MSHRLVSVLFAVFLFIERIKSKSITFSYRTCLSETNLVDIEHRQNQHRQYFTLTVENFHFRLIHRYDSLKNSFDFGPSNRTSRKKFSNFDDQYQSAIDFYQTIDRWNYVNLTFDDRTSRVLLSLNNDEHYSIPLMDYPWSYRNETNESILDVEIEYEAFDRNVTCLVPHLGFSRNFLPQSTQCMINTKLCEQRICTSKSKIVEQYCPLFQIFDCYPFTDIACGQRSTPVVCSNNHCLNGGSCSIDLLRNRSRCICPSGFAGDQCQYSIDECQSSPCPQNSKCLDQTNGYKCTCDPGWTGPDCSIDINECHTTKPCQAARTCINLPGSYRCECLENFVGKNCDMILDPCLSEPCRNNATKCHSILDRDHIRYHCTCQSGFTGINCETNINDCEGIVCPKNNTICVDGINSFHCECKSNYKRNWDGACVEQNPCDSSPCHQNATCYNLNDGQYRCICPATFTGSQCDEDIDECQVFPFICRNGGTCINEIGSYRCYCPNGWYGSTCAKAIDHCLSQPCHRNSSCINKVDGYECRCSTAFTGSVCQYDIDECLINPCLNNGSCHNFVGGFHCRCPAGYFGFNCEYPPSECERLQQASFSLQCNDPILCRINKTEKLRQMNQLSTYTCKTERDRMLDQYFTCLDERSTDQCHCPSDLLPCSDNYTDTLSKAIHSKSLCPCENGASCYRLSAIDYRCYCSPGFTGQQCEIRIDPCMSRPCYNNATCSSVANSFTCKCTKNYQGRFCQTLIDPCSNDPCENNGTCQIRNRTDYQCSCSSKLYSGRNCEIYRSPCSSRPCLNGAICRVVHDSFLCQCPLNYRGRYCEEEVNRCESKFCMNGGTCSQTNGTVQCLCLPGFSGLFCELNVDECFSQPCSMYGRCIDLINGYRCACDSGWTGFHCESKLNDISKSFNYRSNLFTVFHLRQSSINISKVLPYRHSSLPIRIQYEFRTTIKQATLLSIGHRFKQQLMQNKIFTNLDNKTILSSYLKTDDHWLSISVEVFYSWIDVRIGKNSLSQRFYIGHQSLADLINQHVLFGEKNNYTGCVRNIEITYSQVYSILLTDQLIDTNENRTLGCEKTNACEQSTCRFSEYCVDHWFYYSCHCRRPFYGEQCDEIAPILRFDHQSSARISTNSIISNISLFFNTIDKNGDLFEIDSSSADDRSLTLKNRTNSKVMGSLIDGQFRVVFIDDGPKRQEYDFRTEQTLNDGEAHRIDLDLNKGLLIIDQIQNESLTKFSNVFPANTVKLFSNSTIFDGWFQDLRINDEMMFFDESSDRWKIEKRNLNISTFNPCHPINPCQNGATCLVTVSQDYRCQCEENWFGRNCSEINICNYNKTSLCPKGFICKTTGDNQECLAVATFNGNSSSLMATLNSSAISAGSNEISFRLRARPQRTHLLTIKNLYTSDYFSLYLFDQNLIYRDSIHTTDLLIELNNETFEQWTSFHLYWSDFSTLTFNHQQSFTVKLSLKSLLTPTGQTQIFIGNGFRGCLEYLLVGEQFYLPFYDDRYEKFRFRTKKFLIEQFENVKINNCTFDGICEKVECQHGHCVEDFDRGKCMCQLGWSGEFCQSNIDECAQGNNCSKENGVCVDHPDGYYTCECHPGFTGRYCETNIDDCSSSPCRNNATCTDLVDGYRCHCGKDFIGFDCSRSINETCLGTVHSCQNNGTCQLLSDSLYVDQPKVECQCQLGFFGQWCQEDACLNLSCQHESRCQRLPNGKAECLCDEYWHGDQCQHDVNECQSNRTNPCLNNGTCMNTVGSYRCECLENYLGLHCERKHVCLESSPCLNHGVCRILDEEFSCDCLPSFTGSLCQWMTCAAMPCEHNGTCINDPQRGFQCNCTGTGYEGEQCSSEINECYSNPCMNNGSCIDQIDGYLCLCPKNFFGSQCESKALFGAWKFSYHYVLWPILIVFLLLSIILLTVVGTRIRESRRSRGTYQPALNENGQTSRVEFSMILKPPPEERLI